jgi:hypothetical protein
MTNPVLFQLVLTFLCGAAYEWGCVFWVQHSEAGRAGRAALWSMFVALVTAVGVEQFLKGYAHVAAYVLGYGAGTYVAISLKRFRASDRSRHRS